MKYLILFFSLLFANNLLAQETIPKPKKFEYAFSPGVVVQGNFHNEFNFMVGKITQEKMFISYTAIRAGVETNFLYNEDFIIAPKIGFEYSVLILTFRLTGINYFQNSNSNFYIYPEVGISLGGSVNLTYGYNSLKNCEIDGLSKHRIGLSININRKLNKGTLYK